MNYNEHELENEFKAYAKLIESIYELENAMVTAADIQTGIIALSKATDLLKKAKELSDKTQNIEIKEIIIELRSSLVDTKNLLIDTKVEVSQLKEENESLRAEIKQLIVNQQTIEQLTFNNGLYISNENDYFCGACYDSKKQLIRVKLTPKEIWKLAGKYSCPVCKNHYQNVFLSSKC
jgi:hypothetical protein